jgi:ABC-2 type transport system permease protein
MTLAQRSRLLRRLVALNMAVTLAYPFDFFCYMLGAVLGPLIAALVWRAAVASGAELPVDTSYLMTYFVLLAVVSMLTSSWLSGFLANSIRDGKLSVWLARPGSFLYELMANNVAEKAFKSVMLFPMIAIFAWLFREDIELAASAWQWGIALLAILMGAVISISIDVAEGSLAFWLDDVSGLIKARGLATAVLAGQVVPLALMPEWAQGFLRAQPFRYVLSFPLELMVGDLTRNEIAYGVTLQVMYTVLFVATARWLWTTGKRSYAAVGA